MLIGSTRNNAARFGGNGGLSLRRVSKILEVLHFQKPYRGEFYEDQWMAARVGLLPGAKMAAPEIERDFAVESLWSERPMGYHLNPAGLNGEVWDDHERRKSIYGYCPEIKIILDMRLERERCPVNPTALNPEQMLSDQQQAGSSGEGVPPTDTDRNKAMQDYVEAIMADHNVQPISRIYQPGIAAERLGGPDPTPLEYVADPAVEDTDTPR